MTLITQAQNGIPAPVPARSATTRNGNLWTVLAGASGTAEFWVLSDGNWSRAANRFPLPLGAFRIDEDDNASYLYQSGSRLYFVRGTPNAERTQWTWGSPVEIRSSGGLARPDFVVHKEGDGWVAHVVYERHTSYTSNVMEYEWRTITTETVTWDVTPEYPANETWRAGHDHTFYAWGSSATASPWADPTAINHAHTLSGFAGARTHDHSIVDHSGTDPGSPTGKTRTISSSTHYNSVIESVRVTIDASGEITSASPTAVSPQYSDNRAKYPSIAFRHVGDEKAVETQPDLFVGWSTGREGTSYGIRLKKATYAAGNWTWGTEQAMDPGYVANTDNWLNVVFDGIRAVVGGLWRRGSGNQLVFKERDVADTTTTTLHEGTVSPLSGANRYYLRGALTYDGLGNIYVAGAQDASPYVNATIPTYSIWDRAEATMGDLVPLGSASSNKSTGQTMVKRGFSHSAIDIFHGLATSPYSIFHDRVELVDKPLKTKIGGKFLAGEIAHRTGGTFERGTIHRRTAGAFV